MRAEHGENALSPVWSPDGNKVFFITENALGTVRQLKTMRPDGSDERLLCAGDFARVAISPTGKRLAVVYLTTASRYVGGRLLLLDTSGTVIDTLTSAHDTILCCQFGQSDTTLYYYADRYGFFRMDLNSRRVDSVLPSSLRDRQDFSMLLDTLIFLPDAIRHTSSEAVESLPVTLWQPRPCPSDLTLVLGVKEAADDYGYLGDMVLVNRSDGSVSELDARAYRGCDIVDPSWSPDGQYVLMSIAELVPGNFGDLEPRIGRYDIWKLRIPSR